MTMFPQEPHLHVSDCMYNLTNTTQVHVSKQALPVAHVLGDYYMLSLATSHGSLSRVQTLAGTVRSSVGATSHRLDHAPTHEAKRALQKTPVQPVVEGTGQRACTVPTSATTAVICLNSTSVFSHRGGKVEMRTGSVPRFHPTPWNGVGLPAPVVNTDVRPFIEGPRRGGRVVGMLASPLAGKQL